MNAKRAMSYFQVLPPSSYAEHDRIKDTYDVSGAGR